ncbi:hypothetical protein GE09DRAFT_1231249 [Coniochaeta sp. 2T2.1]|nr:hypothetical protein GE09DRAFT_1231249 [Coniochaeta sp. 2T2.1]
MPFMRVKRHTYTQERHWHRNHLHQWAPVSTTASRTHKPDGHSGTVPARRRTTSPPLTASRRKGPFGDDAPQTSNRAELRAVIAALRFRHWPRRKGSAPWSSSLRTLEYAVEGATNWARALTLNGWKRRNRHGSLVRGRRTETRGRRSLGEVERFERCGMAVKFWRIPREWSTVADRAAKEAACRRRCAGSVAGHHGILLLIRCGEATNCSGASTDGPGGCRINGVGLFL